MLSRAGLEYYRALAEVRQDVADDGETSSEDEPFADEAPLFLKSKGFSSSDPAALDRRGRERRGGGGREESVAGLSIHLSHEDGDEDEIPPNDADSSRLVRVMDTLAPEADPVSNDEYDDAAGSGSGAQNAASQSATSSSSTLTTPSLLNPAITEDRYKRMLKRHKKRRKNSFSASSASSLHGGFQPDLCVDGLELNDVIRRTGSSLFQSLGGNEETDG